jgi:hypothetical protein
MNNSAAHLQSPGTVKTDGANEDELNYYRGLRFLLLARAYESQENKIYAVQFYKEALKYNAASYEAFSRLISNHLLTKDERRGLLEESLQKSFENHPEDLWLKDFYQSKIE